MAAASTAVVGGPSPHAVWQWGPISQFLGVMTEAWDVTIILTLSPILARVFLPSTVPTFIGAALVVVGFAVSYITRPIGSAIFGHFADRIGRRQLMIISMVSMAIVTVVVAAFPSYLQAGYLGYSLLLFVRALVGIIYGGEYTAGYTFAQEWTPQKWRGLSGGLAIGGYGTGGLIGSLTLGALIAYLGTNAMIAFGWRYVFISGLVPFAIVIIIRLLIGETPIFKAEKASGKIEKSPVSTLFRAKTRPRFLQSMFVMLGFGTVYAVPFAYLSAMLTSHPSVLTTAQTVLPFDAFYLANIIAAIVVGGMMSQYVGRRKLLMTMAVVILIAIVPTMYGIVTYASLGNVLTVSALAFVLGLLVETPYGVFPSYLTERFGTSHRAAGSGLAYSLGGNTIPGLFLIFLVPPMVSALGGSVWMVAGIFAVSGTIVGLIAAFAGPETVNVKLEEVEAEPAKTSA